MRFAAIDIGSNSVRLLVAEISDRQGWSGPVETVARAGEVCRLGRGLRRHRLLLGRLRLRRVGDQRIACWCRRIGWYFG